MKKRIVSALSVLTAACVLAGCANTPKHNFDASHPVSITIWTYYNGEQLASFNALVDKFNETVGKEKGIYVESYTQGSVNDLETSVLAAAEGKVGADPVPNIFAAYADTAYAVDRLGLAVDISEYMTDKELARYMDNYIEEGRFPGQDGMKIFPTAKSTEVFLLNKTDWDKFAAASGATYEDLSTIEKLVKTAERYYQWTDSLTDEPEDGRALFGRDAAANYILIGSKQLGTEIFGMDSEKMSLNFDKGTIRTLWDNYYVPLVKGYFTAEGRFRSDDVKIGNCICFVGSSSGATFFPEQVILSDTESYPIEMVCLPNPQFEGGERYAVQQGAGMVVTNSDEDKVHASVEFLKWFTSPEQNISFSVGSGYLPVMKESNSMDAILSGVPDITPTMQQILQVALDTVTENSLYTPKAFPGGTKARAVLENSMTELALADRTTVMARIHEGQSLSEASAPFLEDSYFEAWYEATLKELQAYEAK